MTLTLEITPEVEAALKEKAQRRGMALDAYLLDAALRDEPSDAAAGTAAVTAASVRGKYARPGGATVDDFLAERHAEAMADEAEYQARKAA